MIVPCKWCTEGEREIPDEDFVPGSSYICDECRKRMNQELQETMKSHTRVLTESESQQTAKP